MNAEITNEIADYLKLKSDLELTPKEEDVVASVKLGSEEIVELTSGNTVWVGKRVAKQIKESGRVQDCECCHASVRFDFGSRPYNVWVDVVFA